MSLVCSNITVPPFEVSLLPEIKMLTSSRMTSLSEKKVKEERTAGYGSTDEQSGTGEV